MSASNCSASCCSCDSFFRASWSFSCGNKITKVKLWAFFEHGLRINGEEIRLTSKETKVSKMNLAIRAENVDRNLSRWMYSLSLGDMRYHPSMKSNLYLSFPRWKPDPAASKVLSAHGPSSLLWAKVPKNPACSQGQSELILGSNSQSYNFSLLRSCSLHLFLKKMKECKEMFFKTQKLGQGYEKRMQG